MEVYIFLPLYNVKIEDDILNQDFNGFKIITSDIFISEYENLLYKSNILDELHNDIKKLAKYILYKKKIIKDKTKIGNIQQLKNNSKIEFDNFILLARLLKEGRIQVHNIYFFSEIFSSCFKLQNSTNIDNIKQYFSYPKILLENDYKFDKTLLNSIIEKLYLTKIPDNKKLSIPIKYFIQYYSTSNLFDRVIKLAIILESTMLADSKEELKHKLRIRICTFLQKDIDNVISIFYDIRSSIVHNGYVSESLYKKIKNIFNYHYETDTELLFYYIQNEVEPIVREILYKSLYIFNSSAAINNFTDLLTEIDKKALSKLII